jgi:glycosyltransferase involved in cell wall biosynthesis
MNQTFQDWECIIVNDGSPDNTFAVAKIWLEKDARFKYLEKQNGGLSSARNAGIAIAKGDYILPLDADDKIGNLYCELAMKEFEKNPHLNIVYCKANKFGTEKDELKLKEFSKLNLATENVIFCSAFFKKADWIKVNGYDENMIFGLEDWEFWISILKVNGKVQKINYFGFYYRIKEQSMLSNLKSEQKLQMQNYISIKHADFFISQKGNFFKLFQEIGNFERILNSKKAITKLFIKKVLFCYLPLKK